MLYKGLIDDVVRSVTPASGWKVLIVDQDTMRIISASCRMYDIMEEGVTCEYKQKKFPLIHQISFSGRKN